MKKIILSSLSVIALAILGTGCLKDKDYDNQVYGSQITSSPAVSFPARGAGEVIIYGLISQATPYDLVGPHIALEGTGPLSTDVHVTLAVQDALVDSANVHDASLGLVVLPPSEYTINLNRTIVAGQPFDSVIVTFSNLANLDPNNTYGIGLAITSVDNGFQIVTPQKNIVLQISIRNLYDGVVNLRGKTYHPTNATLAGQVSEYETTLLTANANSVDLGTSHHWADGSGSILSPTINPRFTVDAGTNAVTITNSVDQVATPISNTVGYNSHYDPATKTIYAEWTYAGSGGNRIFTDTIVWIEPRP